MRKQALLGIFSNLEDLLRAVEAIKKTNVKVQTVYSPVPLPQIQEALGLKPSPVRYFTLFGGFFGLVVGVGLATYAGLQWNFIVGGKPVVAWPPFVVVGFEFTILLGVLFTIAGMLIKGRIPKVRLPEHYDIRFSQDRFGLLIHLPEGKEQEISRLLKEAGADEINEYQIGEHKGNG